MGNEPYRVPRRPSWQNYTLCDKWMKGHCGHCDPCLSGQLYHANAYIKTLREECRRLANRFRAAKPGELL